MFKEWFKNEKTKHEVASLEKKTTKKIWEVMKEAKTDNIDALSDSDFREKLINDHPKTMDDSLADDHALHSMINSETYDPDSEKNLHNEKVIGETIDMIMTQLNLDNQYLFDQGTELAKMEKRKIGLLHEQQRVMAIVAQKSNMVTVRADEFFDYESSYFEDGVHSITQSIKKLEQEIEKTKENISIVNARYETDLARYKALTDNLDPDEQSSVESKN